MRIFRCLFGGMNSVVIDPQGVLPVDLTGGQSALPSHAMTRTTAEMRGFRTAAKFGERGGDS
jgi:hypothetical protein